MAQPPPSILSSNQATTFSSIDAAVAAIIENNPSTTNNNNNGDIIGTAIALSTATMDRVESMMHKLRQRGRRIKASRPLTVERPFARGTQQH